MRDFMEILSFFGYDLIAAQIYINEHYRAIDSVIEETLAEAGLD